MTVEFKDQDDTVHSDEPITPTVLKDLIEKHLTETQGRGDNLTVLLNVGEQWLPVTITGVGKDDDTDAFAIVVEPTSFLTGDAE